MAWMLLCPGMSDSAAAAPRARPMLRPREGFDESPLVVFYETTQACDLVCAHCRACAQPRRNPGELSPAAALALLDDFARFPDPPLVVLTGGDPMKRPDICEIVSHGVSRGLSGCQVAAEVG